MLIEVPVETGRNFGLGVCAMSFIDQGKAREEMEIVATQVKQSRNANILRVVLLPHHIERHVHAVFFTQAKLQAKTRIQQARMQKEPAARAVRKFRRSLR